MHVGIDACCWSNRRGFGRYTRELVTAMVEEHADHAFTLVVDEATASGSSFPSAARLLTVRTSEQPTQAASAAGARRLSDMWRLGRAAVRERFDVFFFPAVYSFYPLLGPVPTVVTFHDALAEMYPTFVFPGLRAKAFWAAKVRLALATSDAVLTVSASAREQIAAHMGCPRERIRVVLEGPPRTFRVSEDAVATAEAARRHGLDPSRPIVLYVGGLSPHKNLDGLLRAVASLPPDLPRWQLALVGDRTGDAFLGFGAALPDLCRALGLGDRVVFTGFVPDADLAHLYNAATMLVLPSLGEGFGLPVLEAMACGLPVAASDRGSIPEVLSGAGLLFDPGDGGSMAAAIERLLRGDALRARLREAGLRRTAEFSWRRAAADVMRLLQETALP